MPLLGNENLLASGLSSERRSAGEAVVGYSVNLALFSWSQYKNDERVTNTVTSLIWQKCPHLLDLDHFSAGGDPGVQRLGISGCRLTALHLYGSFGKLLPRTHSGCGVLLYNLRCQCVREACEQTHRRYIIGSRFALCIQILSLKYVQLQKKTMYFLNAQPILDHTISWESQGSFQYRGLQKGWKGTFYKGV